jgi:hypothetical protein
MDDVDAEILRLRGRIDVQGTVIKSRVKKVPLEVVKLVVPGYLATKVTAATIGVAASAVGLLISSLRSKKKKEKNDKVKQGIWSSVKKLAIFGGLGFAFKKWKDHEDEKLMEHQTNLNGQS